MDTEKRKSKKVLTVLLLILFFLVGSVAGYFIYDYFTSQGMVSKINDPDYVTQLQEQQMVKTLEDVGKIILLPDENPTIATLLDIEALRADNPDFYANAKVGDLLLIYSEKAIIYREDEKKIINVAPVFMEPAEDTEQLEYMEDGSIEGQEGDGEEVVD